MKLPPPPKWDKTNDGIGDAHKWAADYERSWLPPDIIFPRTDQIWEAVHDCEVHYIAFIPKKPALGGIAKLRLGERVRVLTLEDPKPIQVSFQPVRYDELHESIVPENVRGRPGYSYYWLCLRMALTPCCFQKEEPGFFHELFKLVDDMT